MASCIPTHAPSLQGHCRTKGQALLRGNLCPAVNFYLLWIQIDGKVIELDIEKSSAACADQKIFLIPLSKPLMGTLAYYQPWWKAVRSQIVPTAGYRVMQTPFQEVSTILEVAVEDLL